MSQHLDRRQSQQTYRRKSGLMSPGLLRAREPFRMRNALTGLGLGLFAFGVYSYSISAVKQDVFDDIDEEAKALARTGTPSGTPALPVTDSSSSSTPATIPDSPPAAMSKDEEQKIMQSAFDAATRNTEQRQEARAVVSASPVPSHPPRGVLQKLDSRFPNLLDPKNKTLVWGAPPIDNIGKISSK